MICQNCTNANRESKVMLERGYIRCAVARQDSQYKSEVMERDCKDYSAITWTEAQIKQHDRDAEMILSKMEPLHENDNGTI